jgi:hypothetical protein
MFGTLVMLVMSALYIVFAFREPPAAIAHYFQIPVVAVFFRPEHRVKYGRLTIGVLLLLVGPLCFLLPTRGILGTLAGLVILGVILAARWKRAGEVVEADNAERIAQWQSFEILKRDPRLPHLQHYLYAKGYRTTFERVSDATTYRIVYLALADAQWRPLLAPDGAAAACRIVAYLERDAAPKRVQASLELHTGVCTDREAGMMGWSGAVPLQPMSA